MQADLQKLWSKPWLNLPPDVMSEISLPKGFITEEERACYHYIARHCTTGVGQIVDAGACLGASAFCFASGLARNPARGSTLIHSYDRFLCYENYVADMIAKDFRPLKSEMGDDFYDIFEFQTGKYKELILPYRGDFMKETWGRAPIDILFVDLAKSSELHDHIVQQFYPSLIPGRSLLLHQDFYFCWLPFIHTAMQFLAPHFEIVDRFIPSASRLYLLKEPIPARKIEHVGKFSREERIQLLDAFIDGEQGDMRAMAHVVKMVQLWYDKDEKAYNDERQRLVGEFGVRPEANWGNQLLELDKLGFADR